MSQQRKSPTRINETVGHHSEPGALSPFSSSTELNECMDENERKSDAAGKPKPIPIREVVGESSPRPAGRTDGPGSVPASQAPGLRGQRERPEGPRGKGPSRRRERGRGSRPDGSGMAPGREEPQRPQLAPTPLEELPHRNFEHDGCEWIVRLCGQASTGSAIEPGAPVMHLFFYKAADPDVACGDTLVAGRSLEGLPELRLLELLAGARSAPSANETGG